MSEPAPGGSPWQAVPEIPDPLRSVPSNRLLGAVNLAGRVIRRSLKTTSCVDNPDMHRARESEEKWVEVWNPVTDQGLDELSPQIPKGATERIRERLLALQRRGPLVLQPTRPVTLESEIRMPKSEKNPKVRTPGAGRRSQVGSDRRAERVVCEISPARPAVAPCHAGGMRSPWRGPSPPDQFGDGSSPRGAKGNSRGNAVPKGVASQEPHPRLECGDSSPLCLEGH
jgi:hypothetical protein